MFITLLCILFRLHVHSLSMMSFEPACSLDVSFHSLVQTFWWPGERLTVPVRSQQWVPQKLVAYFLNYIQRVAMLAWAIWLSHWMQSHSCEILYETCLDGITFPAIYSIAFHIATCFVFLDGMIEKSTASLSNTPIDLLQAPLNISATWHCKLLWIDRNDRNGGVMWTNIQGVLFGQLTWNSADHRYLSKKWVCCGVRALGKDFNIKTTCCFHWEIVPKTLLKLCCCSSAGKGPKSSLQLHFRFSSDPDPARIWKFSKFFTTYII